MMNIQITNINLRYQEGEIAGVQVFFNGSDEEKTININGYIPLTSQEYSGNESISSLSNLVKQKISERLLSPANEA